MKTNDPTQIEWTPEVLKAAAKEIGRRGGQTKWARIRAAREEEKRVLSGMGLQNVPVAGQA